jgi:hypothetical protein
MRTTPLVLASLSLTALAACSPAAAPSDDGMAGTDAVTVGWLLEDTGTDDTGMQTSHVALLVGESGGTNDVAVGDNAGCGEETMPEDGPILTLTCWWAGGGDEFQVRMDGTNTLVVDHRVLDEEADIPEFTELTDVTIPDGATVSTTAMKKI